tara:strand:- start:5 stop:271 length:267 start_codon:yes stop_codon:yes gene_type:complete
MSDNKNKYRLTITEAHSDMYKVEITDKHASYTCVYEPSIEDAIAYASYWFGETEARRKSNIIHGKAVKQMIELDRKAGITTNMSDGLD